MESCLDEKTRSDLREWGESYGNHAPTVPNAIESDCFFATSMNEYLNALLRQRKRTFLTFLYSGCPRSWRTCRRKKKKKKKSEGKSRSRVKHFGLLQFLPLTQNIPFRTQKLTRFVRRNHFTRKSTRRRQSTGASMFVSKSRLYPRGKRNQRLQSESHSKLFLTN